MNKLTLLALLGVVTATKLEQKVSHINNGLAQTKQGQEPQLEQANAVCTNNEYIGGSKVYDVAACMARVALSPQCANGGGIFTIHTDQPFACKCCLDGADALTDTRKTATGSIFSTPPPPGPKLVKANTVCKNNEYLGGSKTYNVAACMAKVGSSPQCAAGGGFFTIHTDKPYACKCCLDGADALTDTKETGTGNLYSSPPQVNDGPTEDDVAAAAVTAAAVTAAANTAAANIAAAHTAAANEAGLALVDNEEEIVGGGPNRCEKWCEGHAKPWATKCAWRTKACNTCNQCPNRCEKWCEGHAKPWETKCAWRTKACNTCSQCPEKCEKWCEGHQKGWGDKCAWRTKSCSKCSQCTDLKLAQAKQDDDSQAYGSE